jgi:hypothetical protein
LEAPGSGVIAAAGPEQKPDQYGRTTPFTEVIARHLRCADRIYEVRLNFRPRSRPAGADNSRTTSGWASSRPTHARHNSRTCGYAATTADDLFAGVAVTSGCGVSWHSCHLRRAELPLPAPQTTRKKLSVLTAHGPVTPVPARVCLLRPSGDSAVVSSQRHTSTPAAKSAAEEC